MTIDYDKYGHCVLCHKKMIVERVVGEEVVRMFTPEKKRIEFLLNDGSSMGVSICKWCDEKLNPNDFNKVMGSVYKGWEIETEGLVTSGFINNATGRK